MGRRAIDRIRRAVREGRYEVTEHALEEAEADGFDADDIRTVLLAGRLRMEYTHDPRGRRYCVVGPARDAELCIICRFTETRDLRVITAYAETNE